MSQKIECPVCKSLVCIGCGERECPCCGEPVESECACDNRCKCKIGD